MKKIIYIIACFMLVMASGCIIRFDENNLDREIEIVKADIQEAEELMLEQKKIIKRAEERSFALELQAPQSRKAAKLRKLIRKDLQEHDRIERKLQRLYLKIITRKRLIQEAIEKQEELLDFKIA